jgi:hypothetical protein
MQVFNLALANGNKPWDKLNEKCPSCQQEKETTAHTLYCNEAGQVDALIKSIDLLDSWLLAGRGGHGTDPSEIYSRIRQG